MRDPRQYEVLREMITICYWRGIKIIAHQIRIADHCPHFNHCSWSHDAIADFLSFNNAAFTNDPRW